MRRLLPETPPSKYNSRFDFGIENISVSLLNPPNQYEAAENVATFAETTFGDIKGMVDWRGTEGGADKALLMAQGATEFKHVVPNALETVSLTFAIDGVSRATTHQLVRTRVGASFGQFSQRANPINGFNMRIPDSVKEMMPKGAVDRYIESVEHLNRFYETALSQGVPYQDARYFIPEGCETSITATYNLLSLMGTIQRRACNRMQWEINYVARLMADEVVRAIPWVGRSLRTRCERGVCQTTDPMFSPSCVYYNKEQRRVMLAEDSPALKEMSDGEYNWDRLSNDAFRLFYDHDCVRVYDEGVDPNVSVSMLGKGELAWKDEKGIWRNDR